MPDSDVAPGPVTLPGYAVRDLLAYLDRADTVPDRTAACDVLRDMAGYLRASLARHAQTGEGSP